MKHLTIKELTWNEDLKTFTDKKGYEWDSQLEYLQIEILGLCGCGNPREISAYIMNFLQQVEDNKFDSYENLPYMFLCYWADNKGFLEHGTTIRCGWLTDKGKILLNNLKIALENKKETPSN